MQNKVTSYETSKALAEAGFESESHCGWWGQTASGFAIWHEGYPPVERQETSWSKDIEWLSDYKCAEFTVNKHCKAYDCWDLLTYLFNNGFASYYISNTDEIADYLAQAVLKILGEKE